LTVVPPVVSRRWKAIPLLGVRMTIACLELADRLSRIMTPPLAQGSVFSMLATRARIVPSPESS